MKQRESQTMWMSLSIVAVLSVFGLGLYRYVTQESQSSIRDDIHRILYGMDRVHYHNRTYLNPSDEVTLATLEKKFGQGEPFIATGDVVDGFQVYDTKSSLEFQKQHHVVSTLLFLKKTDGNFVVYQLSGGP